MIGSVVMLPSFVSLLTRRQPLEVLVVVPADLLLPSLHSCQHLALEMGLEMLVHGLTEGVDEADGF